MKKVFVSGCYDLLHSGHVEFFRQASQYGDLYVGIGSDQTILGYKHHKTFYPEQERLFMVKSIKYVKDAYINAGDGIMDFVPTIDIVKPDIFVVNADGSSETKRKFCEERGASSTWCCSALRLMVSPPVPARISRILPVSFLPVSTWLVPGSTSHT